MPSPGCGSTTGTTGPTGGTTGTTGPTGGTTGTTDRTGGVAGALTVREADELMLITNKGKMVRTRVAEIRELGRATQGVTLIGLDEGSRLSGLQRIVENDAPVEDDEGTDGAAGAESEGN